MTEGDYLSLVAARLNAQAKWSDRYGAKSYNRLLETMRDEEREQMMKDRQEMMGAFQTENKWFLNKAMKNFESGVTRPSNPTREIITNLSNKKIVRPITDKEAGIIYPDGNYRE